MRLLRATYLVLTGILFSSSLGAQQVPGILSTETREMYSRQMEAFRLQYPVEAMLRGSSVDLPPVKLTHSQMRELIENSDVSWKIIDPDKVLAFLEFYAIEHPDETACMIGLALQQHENHSGVFTQKSMPESLAFLPVVKSGMNPQYASPQGAFGSWQFMYSTARLYNLRVNEFVDERLENQKATEAAARMLNDLFRLYDNWPLALAAYNCGPAKVNKAIKMAGDSQNVSAVYKHLPLPEADMYHAFVAMNILIRHPLKFGIEPVRLDDYTPRDTVFVRDELHLGQVADLLAVDKAVLDRLNPAYTLSVIPASGQEKYPLFIPQGKALEFAGLEDSMYHHRDTFYFDLKSPEKENKTASGAPAPRVPGGDYTPVNYTIKSGDNIGFLAEWFDTPASDIRYWNDIHGNMIRAGQTIVVYVPKSKLEYYAAVDKLSFQKKQAREGRAVESEKPKAEPKEELKPGEYDLYTVQSGDNPWQIAKQFPGVSDQDILRWNGIGPRDLRPGQQLKIKKIPGK